MRTFRPSPTRAHLGPRLTSVSNRRPLSPLRDPHPHPHPMTSGTVGEFGTPSHRRPGARTLGRVSPARRTGSSASATGPEVTDDGRAGGRASQVRSRSRCRRAPRPTPVTSGSRRRRPPRTETVGSGAAWGERSGPSRRSLAGPSRPPPVPPPSAETTNPSRRRPCLRPGRAAAPPPSPGPPRGPRSRTLGSHGGRRVDPFPGPAGAPPFQSSIVFIGP